MKVRRRPRRPKPRPRHASVGAHASSAMDFVFFDIGAGNTARCKTWLSNDTREHVFCFDPLAKDGQDNNRIHVIKSAVASYTGTATMYCLNDMSSCSLLPLDKDGIKRWTYPPGRVHFRTEKTIQVPTVRMDEFMNERRIEKVIFARIESQGTALDVLKSFGQNIHKVMEFAIKVHNIDYELYVGQTTKDELISFMRQHGFSIYDIQDWSQSQEQIIWFVNNLFASSDRIKHYDL